MAQWELFKQRSKYTKTVKKWPHIVTLQLSQSIHTKI